MGQNNVVEFSIIAQPAKYIEPCFDQGVRLYLKFEYQLRRYMSFNYVSMSRKKFYLV